MDEQQKLIQCMDARIEKLEKLLFEKELQLAVGNFYYPDYKRRLDELKSKCNFQEDKIRELEEWTTHLQSLYDNRNEELDNVNQELKKVCEWSSHLDNVCKELQMTIDQKNQELFQLYETQKRYNDLKKRPFRFIMKAIKRRVISMFSKGIGDQNGKE